MSLILPVTGGAPTITSPITHADGWPEPSQDILRRLQAESPRLAIRFYPAMRSWGITVRWAEFDSRRELIRKGEMRADEDYDLVALLPRDCGVDEACAYLATQMRQHSDQSVRNMAATMFRHNDTQFDRLTQPWVDSIVDDVESVVGNRHNPTVFMSDTEARTTRLTNDRVKQMREDAAREGSLT